MLCKQGICGLGSSSKISILVDEKSTCFFFHPLKSINLELYIYYVLYIYIYYYYIICLIPRYTYVYKMLYMEVYIYILYQINSYDNALYIYIDNTIKQDFIICIYIYAYYKILRKIEVNRVIMCVYIDIPLYKHTRIYSHPLQTFDLAPGSWSKHGKIPKQSPEFLGY